MVLDRTGLYGNIGDHHDRLCDLDVYMVRGGRSMETILVILILTVIVWWPREKKRR